MVKKIALDEQTQDILSCMTFTTAPDGSVIGKITAQLERKTYEKVNKALSGLGGKWMRKAGGHVFATDPRPQVDTAIEEGALTVEKDGFFETPPAVVDRMLAIAGDLTGLNVLEPSAGLGAIASCITGAESLLCIEKNPDRCAALTKVVNRPCLWSGDFLEFGPNSCPDNVRFDRILMNPPFESGQDIDHVRHAYSLLAPGGILVSIMGEGPFFRSDRKATEFRDWLHEVGGYSDPLPEKSFHASGTDVATRIVTIRAPWATSYQQGETAMKKSAETTNTVKPARTLSIVKSDSPSPETGQPATVFTAEGLESLQYSPILDAFTSPSIDPVDGPAPFVPRVVSFSRSALSAVVKTALDFTAQKHGIPILANALIDADGTKATVTASDLEVTWRTQIPCDGDVICRPVHASVLLSEINALPDAVTRVEITFMEGSATVNGRCNILTPDAEDFPELRFPEGERLTLSGLAESLKTVIKAASSDATRYVLNAVCIDPAKGKIVATDGFRLHVNTIDASGPAPQLLVPTRAAKLLAKHTIADAVTVAAHNGSTYLLFEVGEGVMMTRPLQGAYPNYEQVMPKSANLPNKVTFSSKDFLKLLEGAHPLSDAGRIRLSVNGSLKIESEASGFGSYTWEIPCHKSASSSPETVYHFNLGFLVDAIKSFPADCVTLEAPEKYGACLINSNAVIMPVRI
jgi:DNA polymerase III sliding clamp (beta) subunit (PCNA family)/predicted RNA methylase